MTEYILEINEYEKRGLINAIKYVIHELKGELSTRTGFKINEFENIIEHLNRGVLNQNRFTRAQLTMLHQVFNEIINGVFIENFESTIGLHINDANMIFLKLNILLEESSLN